MQIARGYTFTIFRFFTTVFCFLAPSNSANKMASALKDTGNESFKRGNYEDAVRLYSDAILACTGDEVQLKETLLANRAASHLKLGTFAEALQDCNLVMTTNSGNVKALYRSAQACVGLNDHKTAFKNLSKLLHIDPKNVDGVLLMRKVKSVISEEQANASEIGNILMTLKRREISTNDALRGMIGLCSDDKSHALDFGKKQGLGTLQSIFTKDSSFQSFLSDAKLSYLDICTTALRLLGASTLHSEFVHKYVDIECADTAIPRDANALSSIISINGKLSLMQVSRLIGHRIPAIAQASISLTIHILKALPVSAEVAVGTAEPDKQDPPLFLSQVSVEHIVRGFKRALLRSDPEVVSLAADAFVAFISDSPEYISPEKVIDTRMESLEDRKKRMKETRMLKKRSKQHAKWAVEMGVLDALSELIDSNNALIRQRAGVCVGRIVNSVDDEETSKGYLQKYLVHCDSSSVVCVPPPMQGEDDPDLEIADMGSTMTPSTAESKSSPDSTEPRRVLTAMEVYRRRAGLESSLFITNRPELGSWALEQQEGVNQLLVLVASCDPRCQEVAAEVCVFMCSCVHVFIYVCVCSCAPVFIYICVCSCAHVFIYVCLCSCVHLC